MLTCYFNKKDLKHTVKVELYLFAVFATFVASQHTPILSGPVNLLKCGMNDQVMIIRYVGQPPLKPHTEPAAPWLHKQDSDFY